MRERRVPEPSRMSSRWSATEEFVVRCAQSEVVNPDALVDIARDSVDWDRFIETVQQHGTAQLTARTIEEHCAGFTPDRIKSKLAADRHRTARQNLEYSQSLIDVCSMLSENGIPVIPYRGPVLSHMTYDDVSYRTFGDIDLLVRRDDIDDIKRLLHKKGYAPFYWLSSTETLSRTQEWAYTKFCRDYRFRNETGSVMIELHWKVLSTDFPTNVTLGSVWDRRENAQIGGQDIHTLSTEDRLFMLSIHGSRHNWTRLQWIVDIAELLRTDSVDWSTVLRWAREQNCRRMFALGPLLANRIYGTPISSALERQAAADPKLESLCERYRDGLFSDDWKSDDKFLQSQLLDRRRDQAALWLKWLFKPTQKEIEMISLPFILLPLYSLIRTGRLCWKGFNSVVK
ncbi:nucleotidyltransferase domain-containing protein [Halorientalis pallida]|uniref:nucleotidyltransferase domain-containing protein n=1 Tax=Halorientalis pallida TaxID=2479928 RepID=UPI003C6F4F31